MLETQSALANGESVLAKLERLQDAANFRDLHWEGSFEEYL